MDSESSSDSSTSIGKWRYKKKKKPTKKQVKICFTLRLKQLAQLPSSLEGEPLVVKWQRSATRSKNNNKLLKRKKNCNYKPNKQGRSQPAQVENGSIQWTHSSCPCHSDDGVSKNDDASGDHDDDDEEEERPSDSCLCRCEVFSFESNLLFDERTHKFQPKLLRLTVKQVRSWLLEHLKPKTI